jgi:hypothetical protein
MEKTEALPETNNGRALVFSENIFWLPGRNL